MTNNNVDWKLIVAHIKRERCTPIISNKLVNATVFNYEKIIQAWADEIGYPLTDNTELSKVAQYFIANQPDLSRAKENYLEFLKCRLLELARAEPHANQHYLNRVENELPNLTFSQLAIERLRYPDFKKEANNPLTMLAKLSFPIYLTSSHHHFIEAALRSVGKTPRTQVYNWREDLADQIPTKFNVDLDFVPSVQSPLVYHAHGIDDYSHSLVLTEDDHLQFLVNVIRDLPKTNVTPEAVRTALAGSLLILLGYDLHNWDLRVVLQGLINKPNRPRSFAIQFILDGTEQIKNADQFKAYMKNYFDKAKFDLYWGQPQHFVQTLYREWDKTL